MSRPARERWQVLTPWTSPDTIQQWFRQTSWWGVSQPLAAQQRMLQELLEAVAGRYLGQQLTLDLGGRRLTFTLGEVRVETDQRGAFNPWLWWTELPGAREMMRFTRVLTGAPQADRTQPTVERVHIDTNALAIDDYAVGDVAATVDGVHLEVGTTTSELITGPVELDVRATRATALEWVAAALPDWRLHLHAGGLIAGRNRKWPITLLGRPEILGPRAVRLHLVAVEVLGRVVRLPSVLARQRTIDVPAPPSDLELTELSVDDDVVRLRLRHPGVRQTVRPEHVRAAVREGIGTFGARVFRPS